MGAPFCKGAAINRPHLAPVKNKLLRPERLATIPDQLHTSRQVRTDICTAGSGKIQLAIGTPPDYLCVNCCGLAHKLRRKRSKGALLPDILHGFSQSGCVEATFYHKSGAEKMTSRATANPNLNR